MKKRYDATTRELFELGPPAWLRFLKVQITDPESVRVIDSNVSTITAEADKVLWVDEPAPWIEHIELQASRDPDLPERIHSYSTLLNRRHKVPVHSTVVLLRPAADGPELNGRHEKRYRNGDVYDYFRYDIVRLWEQSVHEILSAGEAVLPLAPVAAVEPENVPEVLLTVTERLLRDANTGRAAILWAATEVLLGLRYSEEQVEEFVKGVTAMILGIRGIEESSVYQKIFAKGKARGRDEGRDEGRIEGRAEARIEEARLLILRLGRQKYGDPDESVRSSLDAISDLDQLHALLDRILIVSSWDDLLRSPVSPASAALPDRAGNGGAA